MSESKKSLGRVAFETFYKDGAAFAPWEENGDTSHELWEAAAQAVFAAAQALFGEREKRAQDLAAEFSQLYYDTSSGDEFLVIARRAMELGAK